MIQSSTDRSVILPGLGALLAVALLAASTGCDRGTDRLNGATPDPASGAVSRTEQGAEGNAGNVMGQSPGTSGATGGGSYGDTSKSGSNTAGD